MAVSNIHDVLPSSGNGLAVDTSKVYVREHTNYNDIGAGITGLVRYSYVGSAVVTSAISSLSSLTKSLAVAGAIVTEDANTDFVMVNDAKYLTVDNTGAATVSSTTANPFGVGTTRTVFIPYQGVGAGAHTAINQKYMVMAGNTPDITLSTSPVYASTAVNSGSTAASYSAVGATRYGQSCPLLKLVPGMGLTIGAVPGVNWGTADLSDVVVGAVVAVDGAGRMYVDKTTTKKDSWIGVIKKVANTAATRSFSVTTGTGNSGPTSGYTASGNKVLHFELDVRF